MTRAVLLVLLLALSVGCSTHFSTLQADDSSTQMQIVYAISEEQAFQIAFASIATTLPGRKIEAIDGPVRGYSTDFRFLLDTYTQQVLVQPVQGTDMLGNPVRGYYFEVSGSGSSVVQGRAKNVELFERLAEAAKATGKAVAVTGVQRVAYTNAQWRLSDGEAQKSTPRPLPTAPRDDVLNSLERLKGLRDRGVITDQEFEKKKGELLDRL